MRMPPSQLQSDLDAYLGCRVNIMEDRKFVTQPLYVQLRHALTQRISSGIWKPGDSLPNETEIAREFGLSAGNCPQGARLDGAGNLVVPSRGAALSYAIPRATI